MEQKFVFHFSKSSLEENCSCIEDEAVCDTSPVSLLHLSGDARASGSCTKRFSAPPSFSGPHCDKRTNLFGEIPDLSNNICTDFANVATNYTSESKVPFQNFHRILRDHELSMTRNKDRRSHSTSGQVVEGNKKSHTRSLSMGQCPSLSASLNTINSEPVISSSQVNNAAPIWCLDFENDLIVAGCADGNIEVVSFASNYYILYLESWAILCFG